MLDVKVLSFLEAAEKKNFTQAAKALSLTQPAVSHHISQLEQELGTALFIRGKGRLKLTESGETVLRYARQMHSIYERMLITLSDQEKNLTRLRIGITHTAESNLVAEVLAKYGNENPGIVITIITHSIKKLYNMLENYELDLAIVEGAVPDGKQSLNSLLLDTDFLVCAACNDNPLSRRAMVTIRELKKERMILRLPKSGTVNLFVTCLETIHESIDDFNIILEVDNIATIKDLIRKNLGVSILPQSTCMDEVRKGKMTILPIENMSMAWETNIIYQKDFSHLEVLHELTELYRRTARKIISHTRSRL